MPIIPCARAIHSGRHPGRRGLRRALARDPERVLADVREGVVSRAAAERDYGVVIAHDGRDWAVDRPATQARRAQMRARAR